MSLNKNVKLHSQQWFDPVLGSYNNHDEPHLPSKTVMETIWLEEKDSKYRGRKFRGRGKTQSLSGAQPHTQTHRPNTSWLGGQRSVDGVGYSPQGQITALTLNQLYKRHQVWCTSDELYTFTINPFGFRLSWYIFKASAPPSGEKD